jgi:sulfur relay (sulfurtransferase) DsrC/TusE family protein
MKTLYDREACEELLQRIDKLSPDSTALWGKMNVTQMLAHSAAGMDMASGKLNIDRVFMGKLIGGFLKSFYTSDKPFNKNTPTAKELVKVDANDFEKEKNNLKTLMQAFSEGGTEKCTTHPHPFFGKLKPEDWGIGIYKHTDHHLRQFGV